MGDAKIQNRNIEILNKYQKSKYSNVQNCNHEAHEERMLKNTKNKSMAFLFIFTVDYGPLFASF